MYFPPKRGKISHPKEEIYSSPVVSSHTGSWAVHLHLNWGANYSSNQSGHKVRDQILIHQQIHLDKVCPEETRHIEKGFLNSQATVPGFATICGNYMHVQRTSWTTVYSQ